MKNLTIIDHPLIKRDVAILRDATSTNHLFRTTQEDPSIMAFTVTHDLRLRKTSVKTPRADDRIHPCR
jgi:uracil phosphoribosyltransferase